MDTPHLKVEWGGQVLVDSVVLADLVAQVVLILATFSAKCLVVQVRVNKTIKARTCNTALKSA